MNDVDGMSASFVGRCAVVAVIGLLSTQGFCQTTIGPVAVDANGGLVIGHDVTGRVELFDNGWGPNRQSKDTIKAASGFPKAEEGKWELSGDFRVRNMAAPFAISEIITGKGDQAKLVCKLTPGQDVEVKTMALSLQFPVEKFKGQTVMFGEKEVVLPVEFGGSQDVYQAEDVPVITISMPDGKKLKVSGPVSLYMQDDRRFQGTAYTLRLFFTPKNGPLKKGEAASVSVTFEKPAN